jgi:hypothetical protein
VYGYSVRWPRAGFSKQSARAMFVVRAALAALALACFARCTRADDAANDCSADGEATLYQRKIEPILLGGRPTSCNQCHLAGIDLSLFVRQTPCQTMACMQELGLVDLEVPERSTVLSWIDRAEPQSSLITADVIQQEHAAFLEWIEYSAKCGGRLCPPFADPCGQGAAPNATLCTPTAAVGTGFADPGDCQELTLEQVFTADVYVWRERCAPCHFTSDTQVSAPKWISDSSDKRTAPELSCVAGSLETMRNVLRRGLIDLTDPPNSLLLQKPSGAVAHGGGQKFEGPQDPSYLSFLAFIERYASCAAQDATLARPAPPPPPAPPPAPADPDYITLYCNCALRNCHDAAHSKWGVTDAELLEGCRAESAKIPMHGSPTTVGNFLECRVSACEQGAADPNACFPALGTPPCL